MSSLIVICFNKAMYTAIFKIAVYSFCGYFTEKIKCCIRCIQHFSQERFFLGFFCKDMSLVRTCPHIFLYLEKHFNRKLLYTLYTIVFLWLRIGFFLITAIKKMLYTFWGYKFQFVAQNRVFFDYSNVYSKFFNIKNAVYNTNKKRIQQAV